MNPFEQKGASPDKFCSWKQLAPKPYDKSTVNPYTKTRIILMNGTEFEANWFSHQFSRHCGDNDIRRDLALLRRTEQHQQKRIAALKPLDENILETTIGYEQLAVDLTAMLAKHEPDTNVKRALDFALLEDFDHLYRYADLLEMEQGVIAEKLVGGYTEIMPGRPTISEHRFPFDDIRYSINSSIAAPITKLNVNIITAAEQQTMNYYMNVGAIVGSSLARELYTEIAMIEEQHVSHYGSLLDPNCTWLENLLMHEYTECYLYYSCYDTETDKHVKDIWRLHFEQEVGHLHYAAEMLKKYEGKEYSQLFPNPEFPKLLSLESNIEYVRDIISSEVGLTARREEYCPVKDLPSGYEFFKYQEMQNSDVAAVPSHKVIEEYLKDSDKDYRYETAKHPIVPLRDRSEDNTSIGR